MSAASGLRGLVAGEYLKAIVLAGAGNVPVSLRAYVHGPMPTKAGEATERRRALAWLAFADRRPTDGLAWMQQALLSRDRSPEFFRGRLADPLGDDAKQAFLRAGGSESGFALWSRARDPGSAAEGRWETPRRALPAFELPDVAGRTWKLAELGGRAVLINVWATWCGPCRAELPLVQRLYERTRGRSDVQVISLNVDEDVGRVAPYLEEHGYTFPALIGYSVVRGLLGNYSVPQNWIVDPQGNWVATQFGFDAGDREWVDSMLKRLLRPYIW
jgi:thiol-disulfide isomerase/thioredoxin